MLPVSRTFFLTHDDHLPHNTFASVARRCSDRLQFGMSDFLRRNPHISSGIARRSVKAGGYLYRTRRLAAVEMTSNYSRFTLSLAFPAGRLAPPAFATRTSYRFRLGTPSRFATDSSARTLPPDECPFLSSVLASLNAFLDGGTIVSFLAISKTSLKPFYAQFVSGRNPSAPSSRGFARNPSRTAKNMGKSALPAPKGDKLAPKGGIWLIGLN